MVISGARCSEPAGIIMNIPVLVSRIGSIRRLRCWRCASDITRLFIPVAGSGSAAVSSAGASCRPGSSCIIPVTIRSFEDCGHLRREVLRAGRDYYGYRSHAGNEGISRKRVMYTVLEMRLISATCLRSRLRLSAKRRICPQSRSCKIVIE